MAYFAIQTITNNTTKKQTLVISAPQSHSGGYKTEAAARGAMKRKFGDDVFFIVAQFENFKEAAAYRVKAQALLN